MSILPIIGKLILGFIILLLIMRLMGKRNLAQLNAGDVIYLLVFGGILEESLYDNKVKYGHVILTMIAWGLIIFLFEYLLYKSKIARFILKGNTDVLIKEGDVYTKVLKYNRLELDQIHSIARNHGIFDLSEIKNMYIESDGGFTIETYDYKYPLKEYDYNNYDLIKNKTINTINLRKINQNEVWLYQQLNKRGIKSIEDVFYADWSFDRGIHIIKYK
ncbi:DUF421 domain-containing protein [Mammaliicoccus sp. JADD-157]|uniref:DUF421 domain-containing protein n=1 Tax=Mammaliicoccus sp. JADD-157 TaxID=3404818 RepID=UPI003BB74EFE